MVPSIGSGLLLPLLIKKKEEEKKSGVAGVGKRKTVRHEKVNKMREKFM